MEFLYNIMADKPAKAEEDTTTTTTPAEISEAAPTESDHDQEHEPAGIDTDSKEIDSVVVHNAESGDIDRRDSVTASPAHQPKNNSELLKKLRSILDGVASQEADLKRKTHKIQEWHHMHCEALTLAANTKQKLIEFEPVSESDEQAVQSMKAKQKTEINTCLDELERKLKSINACEKKYRSRECAQEQQELSETASKLQSKFKIMSKKYNQQKADIEELRRRSTEHDAKYKAVMESQKQQMEVLQQELNAKHTQFVVKLESQHEAALQAQKDELTKNIAHEYETKVQQLERELMQLKHDQSQQMQKQLTELQTEKDAELQQLRSEIEAYTNDCQVLESKLVEKETELSEYKEREKAHHELMLKWQAQKEKKNEKIIELTETINALNDKNESLETDKQRLQETAAFNSVQITQKETQFNELHNKYVDVCQQHEQMDKDKKLLEAKLKVSIKEIIKLRQETKDKDEKKSELLTSMSNLEISNNKQLTVLDEKIAHLNNEIELVQRDFVHKLALFAKTLNNVHSRLESFSVTIRNFSGAALRSSFDTELQARMKSNHELPAWLENIREQVRKASNQLSINGICNNMQNDEEQSKIIRECETQIAHIKLTGLHILEQQIQLLIEFNNLYIRYNSNDLQKK